MEEKEEKKNEGEVISAKEFLDKHKDMDEKELYKVVLVCGNCKHKDLLKNFLKMDEPDELPPWTPKPYPNPDIPNPWKPRKPYPKPYYGDPRYKRYTCDNKTSKLNKKQVMNMVTSIPSGEYEELFYCPKCGSSLIHLDSDYIKNNTTRLL